MNKNIKGIDSIQTKEIHLGTPDNYTTIKKDGDRIKYGDKTFANTDDIWTIQANGTDVPANGGKVNVKGADGITVSKSANGEMTINFNDINSCINKPFKYAFYIIMTKLPVINITSISKCTI